MAEQPAPAVQASHPKPGESKTPAAEEDEKTKCLRFSEAVLRVLQLVFSLVVAASVAGATGEDPSCDETTAGPGSEQCVLPYTYDKIGSTQMLVATAILSFLWTFFITGVKILFYCMEKYFCEGHGELIQNVMDCVMALLNVVAFIAAAVQLTSGTPDENQGKSILEVCSDADAVRYRVGIALSFFNFMFYALSIALNLRLWS